jgi:hypothetical protein
MKLSSKVVFVCVLHSWQATALIPSSTFVRPRASSTTSRRVSTLPEIDQNVDVTNENNDDDQTGIHVMKPTGTSFLPQETIERAQKGNPIEKIKLQKDGTAAFVDVYEYARQIREGKLSWEEVEKADLDSVSS